MIAATPCLVAFTRPSERFSNVKPAVRKWSTRSAKVVTFGFWRRKNIFISIEMTTFTPRLPIAAITDEFSPNLADALPFMQEIGMTGAELRVIDGKNILDLNNDELERT